MPGTDSLIPVTVFGLSGVTQITAGGGHTCALVQGGTVKCWGLDYQGQLGSGLQVPGASQSTPTLVVGLSGVTQITAGGYHTCALLLDGTVKCWGYNLYGQLGNGSLGTAADRNRPVVVTGLAGVSQITAGKFHTCGLLSGGAVKCWGRNLSGQLGEGLGLPGTDRSAPVIVAGLSGATQIAAGEYHTCALAAGGSMKCWGYNPDGQVGGGATLSGISAPVVVPFVAGVTQITTGWHHTCAIVSGGAMKCWGSNQFGQYGSGFTGGGTVPVTVVGLSGVAGFADFVSLVPARLLDSRVGGVTVDGLFGGLGLQPAQGVVQLDVAGRGGVALDAAAVALNVTVTGATGSGFITVYPCDAAKPNASNLNYVAGDTVANLVVAKVGSNGKVCIYTDGATNLIADVEGFYPGTTRFVSMAPARLLDTRLGGSTGDGLFAGSGPLAAGGFVQLDVSGRAGVPADGAAVVLNVTVTGASGGGFVTVYPCTASTPNASNLNFVAGQTIANLVIAKLGPFGKVCLKSSAGTNLIADINGYYPPASSFVSLEPARVLDTRLGGSTIDGVFQNSGPLAAGTEVMLTVLGRGGVPAIASTVVLNVTATSAQGGGFITVYPCGASRPNASNLNFGAGQTIPNLVITKVGAGGQVCIFTSTTTNILADASGYYP